MFFDEISEIKKIATKTGTAVFVVPSDVKVEIKNALVLKPEAKKTITIEQVREMMTRLNVRQTSEQYVIIRPAEMLGEEAGNALLKRLEEPGEMVHFVLVTEAPSALLTTILSRAAVYFLRDDTKTQSEIKAPEKIKEVAKRLMAAKPSELVPLADELTKKKDGTRAYVLEVVGTAVEMLYKSYFITEKEVFLKKLPRFLQLYENLAKNGHIKLHLVADLI